MSISASAIYVGLGAGGGLIIGRLMGEFIHKVTNGTKLTGEEKAKNLVIMAPGLIFMGIGIVCARALVDAGKLPVF